MSKKYKLLKKLLGYDVGTIFTSWDDPSEIWSPEGKEFPRLSINEIKDPEWFKEVTEWPKSWEELNSKKSNWNPLSPSYFCVRIGKHHKSFKSIIARLKLEEIAKEMNGDWEPDWSDETLKVTIYTYKNKLQILNTNTQKRHIMFKDYYMAQFSLENHKQLWLDYWMINEEDEKEN